MTFGQLLREIFADGKVGGLALLVAADFFVGVAAALKLGTFRLSYVADFLRNDVAFKLVPYFFLSAAATVAGSYDIVIEGLDWGLIAGGAYVVVVAALVGSLLKSIADLGLARGTQTLREALFGAENAAPPK